MRNKEIFWMNGQNTSDVHTCMAKFSISWDWTFWSEVNHKIVVKLNTGCVQNVVATWRCWPAPPWDWHRGFFFFRNWSHLSPPAWDPCGLQQYCWHLSVFLILLLATTWILVKDGAEGAFRAGDQCVKQLSCLPELKIKKKLNFYLQRQ
jgi:hypothetical protein